MVHGKASPQKDRTMKTVEIKIDDNRKLEIKVADKDLETLLKVISAFKRKTKKE